MKSFAIYLQGIVFEIRGEPIALKNRFDQSEPFIVTIHAFEIPCYTFAFAKHRYLSHIGFASEGEVIAYLQSASNFNHIQSRLKVHPKPKTAVLVQLPIKQKNALYEKYVTFSDGTIQNEPQMQRFLSALSLACVTMYLKAKKNKFYHLQQPLMQLSDECEIALKLHRNTYKNSHAMTVFCTHFAQKQLSELRQLSQVDTNPYLLVCEAYNLKA